MTALAANTPRTFGKTDIERLPVEAATKVYAGSTLQWDESNDGVQPYATGTANFAGFAAEKGDNTNGALGDKIIDVHRKGTVILVLSATVALTNRDDIVYAQSDDNTFNLTSSGGMPIGKIVRVVTAGTTGANEVEVYFEAAGFASI